MTASWSAAQVGAALIGALLLLLLHFVLSICIFAASALSHIALRRMSNEAESKHGFLERLHLPQSAHRVAVETLRQLCFVGGWLLLALFAFGTGWTGPSLVALALGALLGVLAVEALLARGLALWNPRAALRATAPAARLAYIALYAVVRPLELLLERVHASTSLSDEEREEEQDEEVEALIELGERDGLLEAEEGEMMRGIVDLDETKVREIMTPRTDIVALALDTPVAQARKTLLEAGHSRLPVYRDSIDTVVGILHARDLFRAWEQGDENQTIASYLRPVAFVPEMSSAGELLGEMRQKSHLSIVVDEYGGIAGLVTLEDLLEEIVGDIRDEHDEEEDPLRQDADGSWIVNAVAHVDELETLFGVEIGERDFDTVGGLVVSGFGRVPAVGEALESHGLLLRVLQADRRRVHKVRVRPLATHEDGTGTAS